MPRFRNLALMSGAESTLIQTFVSFFDDLTIGENGLRFMQLFPKYLLGRDLAGYYDHLGEKFS